MTLDGRGERATTTYGVFRGNAEGGSYRALGSVSVPHSLGLLYERVTSHLGFLESSDEYKVMALAAMGRPQWAAELCERIRVHPDGRFELGPIDLQAMAGPPREPGSTLSQTHLDLAASLQSALETKCLELAGWLRETSGERHLAMAGGVALNCLMNARLRDAGIFERVWVQPAAGDAGTALGAALWVDARQRAGAGNDDAAGGAPLAARRWQMDHAYLGPGWSDEEIIAQLQWARLPFEVMGSEAELVTRCASLLARGAVIGWFQGRMEWGPRALGSRSILASPIDPAMQARLNDLKDREDFRPVAPVVTREAFADWFERAESNGGESPFMLFTYPVRPEQAGRIPSACHSDGSARVQTVDAHSQPRYHALLRAFEAATGVPVLVNTSFNVRGQPVVCSPKDALEAYIGTPLDALVIGNCVLTKQPWP
jgi:carbamoyltransferase